MSDSCSLDHIESPKNKHSSSLANSQSLVISSNDENERSQKAQTPVVASTQQNKSSHPEGKPQVTDFQKVKIFGKNSNKNHEGNINLSTSSFKNRQILSQASGTEKFGSGSKMGLNQRPLQSQEQHLN